MNITLYPIFVLDAPLMTETGSTYLLEPWQDTLYYNGHPSAPINVELPEGFTVLYPKTQSPVILSPTGDPCRILRVGDRPCLQTYQKTIKLSIIE